MRSAPSLLTSRTSKAFGRLSLLALGAGLTSACSSGMINLSEPVFTGSTPNQQQILSGQASAYAQAPAYQPAPTYQSASTAAPVQRRDLPPPGGAGYSTAYAAPAPGYQQPASYTPPIQAQPAYRAAEIQPAAGGAANGPSPYTPPSSGASQAPTLASMPAMPQPRGMPPTTLGEQAQRIDPPRPAPVTVANVDPQSLTRNAPTGMPQAAPQVQAPRPTTTQTAAIGVQPDAAARAAEAATSAPQAQTGGAFRWPVRGRIISGFGKKPNGERNDGINLAVPEGTPVKAAEDGTVIYSGNELKSYGNLVLIRHDNGWVSAYAHNSDLKVKRGDQVRRGEVVALSGMSGGVTTPQVHFELRKDATPVDPVGRLTDA